MSITIALAGNPNSGKTTVFNALTGSDQYVGNWPGVTVEKKEGRLLAQPAILLQDLPGIYSLSPYTPEEQVARGYLVNDKPDAILNILDGSNLERNLYLTTQLLELGIPTVLAINMMDVVKKRGDEIHLSRLAQRLNCPVVACSALHEEGLLEAAQEAARLAAIPPIQEEHPHIFDGAVEHALAHIEESIEGLAPAEQLRFWSVKLFERDPLVAESLQLSPELVAHLEEHIAACERELKDDAQSIITNQRYADITRLVAAVMKKAPMAGPSVSDRVDALLTHRFWALPIFAFVMLSVYFVAVTTVGALLTDFTNDTLFGELILPSVATLLESLAVAPWLSSLIVDGVIGGVGAVLGFVPQMMVLFLLLSMLEDCGYMTRVAFIMDRLFRKFGLSGKSFIPMLIGSGCSVPGIMASRTIEQDKDRRMTVVTTSFIPCGAKMPVVALIAGALFGGAWWVAPTAYFIGVAAVVLSGVILKKTSLFAGAVSPFVMELPPYHLPVAKNIARTVSQRIVSFIKKAGTVILLASVAIWFLSGFGFTPQGFMMVEEMNHSVLATLGRAVSPIFAPLGFGHWQATVATLMGLVAKEEVVGVFGVLYGASGLTAEAAVALSFTGLSGLSFLVFNLLCAPCFAAMGAIRREMNSMRWTVFAIGYLCLFAYVSAFLVYQLGLWLTVGSFTTMTAVALLIALGVLYLLFRRPHTSTQQAKALAFAGR